MIKEKGGDLMGKTVAGFSVDTDVLEETKKLAEENNRTFSNYVNIVLEENIKKERGESYLKKKTKRRIKR